ncbi:hypothetical protein FACS1894182_09840 [Bacteroidia bacterium]|nr:hypothetical protein FACS1894182_09840 [Bacteroidia bacterium]
MYELVNGDYYSGNFQDGKMHGKGTYYWKRLNWEYTGPFVNGKREGVNAVIRYGTDSVFTGNFKDDKRNGQGKMDYLDGSYFSGQYKDGKKDGKGNDVSKDGNSYMAYYKLGKPLFPGTIEYHNGDKYIGAWDMHYQKQSDGTLYKNKEKQVWKGQWINDRMINGWIIYPNCSRQQIADGKLVGKISTVDCFCQDNLVTADRILMYMNERINSLAIQKGNMQIFYAKMIAGQVKRIEIIVDEHQNDVKQIISNALFNIDAIDVYNKSLTDIIWGVAIEATKKIYTVDTGAELQACMMKEINKLVLDKYPGLQLQINNIPVFTTTPLKQLTELQKQEIDESLIEKIYKEDVKYVFSQSADIVKCLKPLAGSLGKGVSRNVGLLALIIESLPETGHIFGNTFAYFNIADRIKLTMKEEEDYESMVNNAIGYLTYLRDEFQYNMNEGMISHSMDKATLFNPCEFTHEWLDKIQQQEESFSYYDLMKDEEIKAINELFFK